MTTRSLGNGLQGQALRAESAGGVGAYVQAPPLAEAMAEGKLEVLDALKSLVLAHEVVFLRQQPLSAPELAQLAGHFGPPMQHGAYPRVPGAEAVQILESTPQTPSKIEVWHSDMTFSATPPAYTILHGQIIPTGRGDTLWASATAAWDGLPATTRTRLAGCHAVHDFRHGFRESLAEPGGEARLKPVLDANPPVRHPVMRIHPETGRKALYVNPLFTTHIEGMDAAESQETLARLHEHLTRPEFVARLAWAPETLVIWDNRSTQHKPVPDYYAEHRKLHRVTVQDTQLLVGTRAP